MQATFTHLLPTQPTHLLLPFTTSEWEAAVGEIAARYRLNTDFLRQEFKAQKEEIASLLLPDHPHVGRLLLLGLGEWAQAEVFRKTMRLLVHKHSDKLLPHLSIDLGQSVACMANLQAFVAAVPAMLLGTYQIGKYKLSPPTEKLLPNLSIIVPEHLQGMAQAAFEEGRHIAEVQLSVMDWVNMPSNRMDALALAEAALASGNRYGYKVRVLHKSEIEREGLGALLAVNQGSELPPTFTIMEYEPANKQPIKTVGLVGKGITFDTGGITLKDGANMGWMKSDMGGAAAVIGAMEAAARLQLPVRLIGIVPATDNKPDGKAMQPGDIIQAYNGMSIEVDDTDAEGRMILADGVAYLAKNFQPDIMIDIATLTGACIFALGYHAAGLFTNNDELAGLLEKSGQVSGERVWRLPLWDDYDSLVRSDMADVKNYGGRPAGAITAAKLIEKFTNQHPAWAHIDIAGTAFGDSPFAGGRSATAFGVRLITEFLKAL
ncbi:leucyl aminopeptidase family protein [Rhodoflexus sp.]